MQNLKLFSFLSLSAGLLLVNSIRPVIVFAADGIPWTHHLSSNEILDYVASDNAVWVGTTGGLAEYDIDSGELQTHSLPAWDMNDDVYRVEVGPDGTVWAMTNETVCRYDGSNWSVYESTYYDTPFVDIKIDSAGTLWGIDDTAYYYYDSNGYHRQNIIPGNVTNQELDSIVIDTTDTVWIIRSGFNYKGYILIPLKVFRIEQGQMTEFEFTSNYSTVTDIVRKPDGTVRMVVLYTDQWWYNIYELNDDSFEKTLSLTQLDPQWNYLDAHLGSDGSIWREENNTIAEYVDGDWMQASSTYIHTGVAGRVDMGPDNAVWCISDRGIARHKDGEWSLYPAIGNEQAVPTALLGFKPDGSLWCQTDQGVARFDGTSWQTYVTLDSINGPVVTDTGLLYHPNPSTTARCADGQITYFTDSSQLDSNTVLDLKTAPDGTLWALTTYGLSYRESGEWHVKNIYGLDGYSISFFAFDTPGNLWISVREPQHPYRYTTYKVSDQGNLIATEISGHMNVLENTPTGTIWAGYAGVGLVKIENDVSTVILDEISVTDIEYTEDGTLWVGTDGDGVYRFADDTWEQFETYPLVSNTVTSIDAHPDLGVIIGTDKGLNRYDDGTWSSYRYDINDPAGASRLPTAGVSKLLIDSNGYLFAVSSELSVADRFGWRNILTAEDELANTITSVVITDDGTIWCGTDGGGIFTASSTALSEHVNPDTELVWLLKIFPDPSNWIDDPIVVDTEGTLYLCNQYKYDGSQWLWLFPPEEFWPTTVRDMDCDGTTVWYSSNSGAYRLEGGSFTQFTTADGLLENAIHQTVITESGDIWCAHSHSDIGVSRYHEGQWDGFTAEDGVPGGIIDGIYAFGGDSLLVKSNTDGYALYDGDAWQPYTIPIGTPASQVTDILSDGLGGIWISTIGWGIYHLTDNNNDVQHYSSASGLPGDSYRSMRRDNAGTIWFLTDGGLVRIAEELATFYALGPVSSFDIDSADCVWAYIDDYWTIQLDPSQGGGTTHSLVPTAIEEPECVQTPTPLNIISNYPNPFNLSTTITYTLPESGEVTLSVYSSTGQQVATLVDSYLSAGTHSVTFDGAGLASGVYFYRIEAGHMTDTGKMILMK